MKPLRSQSYLPHLDDESATGDSKRLVTSSALNQICVPDIIDFELTPDREFLRHVLVQATHCHNRNQIDLENQKSLPFWDIFLSKTKQKQYYYVLWMIAKVTQLEFGTSVTTWKH